MSLTESDEDTFGKYPKCADIQLASKEGSERYYFRNPTGGISSMPAMNADQAARILADSVRGFTAEDFEQVDGFDAEPAEYPDPIDSDRDVNAHDIWMLQAATYKGQRVGIKTNYARKNPTKTTLEILLGAWDDPAEIPLHDRDALQQADGIGPHRAGQIVGAAVANRLIERPVRGESDE